MENTHISKPSDCQNEKNTVQNAESWLYLKAACMFHRNTTLWPWNDMRPVQITEMWHNVE